jgi:hypothetical protein
MSAADGTYTSSDARDFFPTIRTPVDFLSLCCVGDLRNIEMSRTCATRERAVALRSSAHRQRRAPAPPQTSPTPFDRFLLAKRGPLPRVSDSMWRHGVDSGLVVKVL